MSHVAYVNGRYVPQGFAQVHIEDRGYQFSDGVYEVVCVWDGLPVDYAPHIRRLARSLNELRIQQPMSWKALTVAVREIVRRNRLNKGIVYIQINRGVAPRAHPFPKNTAPSVVITAKHSAGPAESVAKRGVNVVTADDIRWSRRDIKSVSLLANILSKQKASEGKAFECLLVDAKGYLTEASAANVWMVGRNKTIVTHPESQTILSGITRASVMKIAKDAGYTVAERPFTLKEALNAKEVFLTGTTTFVMPVVRIDDRAIANGHPGEYALDLRQRYAKYIGNIDKSKAWNV